MILFTYRCCTPYLSYLLPHLIDLLAASCTVLRPATGWIEGYQIWMDDLQSTAGVLPTPATAPTNLPKYLPTVPTYLQPAYLPTYCLPTYLPLRL